MPEGRGGPSRSEDASLHLLSIVSKAVWATVASKFNCFGQRMRVRGDGAREHQVLVWASVKSMELMNKSVFCVVSYSLGWPSHIRSSNFVTPSTTLIHVLFDQMHV